MEINPDTTINSSNYNKKQFWSYKRLKSLRNNKTKKNIKKQQHKLFHIINDKVITDRNLI